MLDPAQSVKVALIGRDHRCVGFAVVPDYLPDILKIGQRYFCPVREGRYREATIYTDFSALPYAASPRIQKIRLTPGGK